MDVDALERIVPDESTCGVVAGDPKGLSVLRFRMSRACTSSLLILVLGIRDGCSSWELAISRNGDPDFSAGEPVTSLDGRVRGDSDRLRIFNALGEPELRCNIAPEGEAERDLGSCGETSGEA